MNERLFILGALVAFAGSLMPNIPQAVQMYRDDEQVRETIVLCYISFLILVCLILLESEVTK